MISVIIPTHNEAAYLPLTLKAVAANGLQCEVIVADACSADATGELAAAGGAGVVESLLRNRGAQMNLGARSARGDALIFLHADTLLPPTALARIEAALENSAIIGGGFARRYDSNSLFLRTSCLLAEARSRLSGWFLGDQAIFVRREVFESLNGFPELALFEDLDFSRRMRRAGRVVTLRPPVVSSARRFTVRGPLRTTLSDFQFTLLYALGRDPNDLAARLRAEGEGANRSASDQRVPVTATSSDQTSQS